MMVKFLLPLIHYVGFWAFGARPTPNQRLIGTGQRLHPWKEFGGGAVELRKMWGWHIFTEISMGFSAIFP